MKGMSKMAIISTTGFIRGQLKQRIKSVKASIVNKQKKLVALEKELTKLGKK